jgi:hypothetical protein
MEDSPKIYWEKYKNIIDLVKWVIGSVVIVVLSLIIESGFKERAEGVQEMQAFDKYVDVVLDAKNPEGRWKLVEFFSTVTPTERLRDKWMEYKKIIAPEYAKFKALKDQEESFKLQDHKSPEVIKSLNRVRKQLVPFEKKLGGTSTQNSYADPDLAVKNFKEQTKNDSATNTLNKLADYFTQASELNNSIVLGMTAELGSPPYEDIQTGQEFNYKTATYSNQYGIESRFDSKKKIWPVFTAKFANGVALFTLTENGVSNAFESPLTNIDWDGVKKFVRDYYIHHLNQLK